jgi:hypothetical protein
MSNYIPAYKNFMASIEDTNKYKPENQEDSMLIRIQEGISDENPSRYTFRNVFFISCIVTSIIIIILSKQKF